MYPLAKKKRLRSLCEAIRLYANR